MDKIEIPISKKKISLLLIGAIVFVISGFFFIIIPETFITFWIRNPQTIRIVGIAAVLFFGAASIYGFRKLFDSDNGLIIDDKGIFDNTNASSVGLIDWIDIIEIQTKQIMSTKFLLIFTNNPDKYLDKATGFKRRLMNGNMKMYGTPLSITSNTLRHNFDDLERLIRDKMIEQKNKMPNR